MNFYAISHSRNKGVSVLKFSSRSIFLAILVFVTTIVTGAAMISIAHASAVGKKSVEHMTRFTHVVTHASACLRPLVGPANPFYKSSTPKTLTGTQLVSVLESVGFKGESLEIAWAVAMRESHGHPFDYNGNARTGDKSYGLFQINMIGSMGLARKAWLGLQQYNDLFDPMTNALAAYKMTKGGTDWGSWGLGHNAYRGAASPATVAVWYSKFPNKIHAHAQSY